MLFSFYKFYVAIYIIFTTFLCTHIISSSNIDTTNTVKRIILLRQEALRKFVSLNNKRGLCSTTRYLIITEFQFGRSGNNLIEFTHGLWLANILNATFAPPKWMQDVLLPFNTSVLETHYCLHLSNSIPKTALIFEITSEDSFFLHKLWNDKEYWREHKKMLPILNKETLLDISRHYLKVYASLWSNPLMKVQSAGEWIITNHLDNNFRYTSVHKRQMEGGCNKLMAEVSKLSDFSVNELPMNRPEWNSKSHPLCEMSLDFIIDTQNMHNRNNSKIFIAFDGRGDIINYKKYGAVFSDVMKKSGKHTSTEMKFVDMFIAIHGDFFILNPRSTFSWEIYLIRTCLGLESVPIVRNNDVYFKKVPDDLISSNRPLWASWTSVIDAFYE